MAETDSYSSHSDDMENVTNQYEYNKDGSRQSFWSRKNVSRASSSPKHKNNPRHKNQDEDEKESGDGSRNEEGRRSGGSFYSEDHDSPSGRSHSPYSRLQTRSPTPQKGERYSGSEPNKAGGVGRRGAPHPSRLHPSLQHRRGVSRSRDSSTPKDLNLVAKRMLSTRLIKINELRNALAELHQRNDELQKENRVLRQLQFRHEKALKYYDDTDSKISQMLAHHSNEIQVLRDRLRRTQERERAAEQKLKHSEEQLQRSQATAGRLTKLVNQRELGAKDELCRRLEEEKARVEAAESKIKELERSMELSNSSFLRQLAADKKKNISAQEEIRTLQEELERLTNKLKEKERELETKNIYAHRMLKTSQRKVHNSHKAVQTEDGAPSPDFPTPPPAVTEASDSSEQGPDEYLSLKDVNGVDRRAGTGDGLGHWEQQKRERDKGQDMGKDKEKQPLRPLLGVREEKTKRLKDGSEKETEEKETSSPLNHAEKENNSKSGHVHQEAARWNREALANRHTAEEARLKKEQLLAKMRTLDCQNQEALDAESSDSVSSSGDHSSSRLSEQKNHDASSLSFAAPEESAHLGDGRGESRRRRPDAEGGAVTTGVGRRALRSQISVDDMAFGSYAPSFGVSPSRGSSGFSPPRENGDSPSEGMAVFGLGRAETERDSEKRVGQDKKSILMQQLFGAVATPAGGIVSASNRMEVLKSPPTTNGVRSRRDALLGFNSGSSGSPASSLSILHVADGKPAVRAIASFDDDLEELAL